jgi:hypothetical protein
MVTDFVRFLLIFAGVLSKIEENRENGILVKPIEKRGNRKGKRQSG